MMSATCHCGAVRIEIPEAPLSVTSCNCSLCRRYGTLWAYYPLGSVQVIGHPEHTVGYVQGDKMLSTVRCRHCGCITHWEPLSAEAAGRIAVNVRNFEPGALGDYRIRYFDGADSWKFFD